MSRTTFTTTAYYLSLPNPKEREKIASSHLPRRVLDECRALRILHFSLCLLLSSSGLNLSKMPHGCSELVMVRYSTPF